MGIFRYFEYFFFGYIGIPLPPWPTLSVATDDKDGNGLKLQKTGPILFSCFDPMSSNITKIIIMVSSR